MRLFWLILTLGLTLPVAIWLPSGLAARLMAGCDLLAPISHG